jgi:L-ascorbate metabolism protein UlaG (beta-lactamase superfamily)
MVEGNTPLVMAGHSSSNGSSAHSPKRRESVPGVRRVVERAVTGARGAVPRYTRELIASVKEERERRGRRGSAACPVVVEPNEAIDAFVAADLAALWIGHATVLLRLGGAEGMTILTDPVFSKRIGMRLGAMTLGLARVCPPALEVEHLPPVDLVLLSHAHFDHLDRPSLKRLVGGRGGETDESGPGAGAHVITASNTRRLVPPGFHDVTELAWRRSARVGNVRVTAIEPAHWGARTALDRHRRFNSYLIESNHHRVLFAGDTAHTHAFDHIGTVDLAVFGIGAYNPWEHAHATPEQVWSMYTRLTDPKHPKPPPRGHLLPMHHSTFILSREPMDEPLRRLRAVASGHEKHIVAEMPGKMWAVGT